MKSSEMQRKRSRIDKKSKKKLWDCDVIFNKFYIVLN